MCVDRLERKIIPVLAVVWESWPDLVKLQNAGTVWQDAPQALSLFAFYGSAGIEGISQPFAKVIRA